ncbi:MAG: integrase core domain-containing protein [Burkholderia sp.]
MGDRFAALEPISQGVREQFGSVEADAVRGLSLRMDHGSQYRSDDFRAPLKFWGITPSYAFVAEPQTNGVAERFNRTMKEQAIHGRVFNNVEEVRAAAVAFKDRYNCEWRLEKLGFKTPLEARQAPLLPLAA